MTAKGLGRRAPSDWEHVRKYPVMLNRTVGEVEKVLTLIKSYRRDYDQGVEGACVGFSSSWMMSLLNRRKYHASWLYREAQKIDEWPGEDYDGTSVRAAMDVLRLQGHRRVYDQKVREPDPKEGIDRNRWATTVDEVRGNIAAGTPVVLGVNWYSDFDEPERKWREYWIGEGDLGQVRGGHAICCYGASDRRQAVKLVNSWGMGYPTVWLPYETLGRLINEDGEAALVADR